MTTYHILNGDCLEEQLKQTNLLHNYIICRECLIEGDVKAGSLPEFWKTRARFIADCHKTTEEGYFHKVVREFEKLKNIPDHSEVCLWFENDLFCQVNLWFVLSLLIERPTLKLYRVFPIIPHKADAWKGFGISSTTMLEQAYANRIPFKRKDIELGNSLWKAYKEGDLVLLKELSILPSDCFQRLEEVCRAHIERFPTGTALGRPDRVVKEILETKSDDFQEVFSEFSSRQGVYGFGDLQLKSIYDRHMQQ